MTTLKSFSTRATPKKRAIQAFLAALRCFFPGAPIWSNKIVLSNFCRKWDLQRLIWLAYSVTCERKGTDCIQVHKVTGGAVVSASAQNVDGLGSIPIDHQFFHLDLWAGMSHHLPTSIVRTLRSIIILVWIHNVIKLKILFYNNLLYK